MLSLHQLSCFLATYEHGSLTAAAEELGYAQPSVSEQIRRLEGELGVRLFELVGRGLVPTEAAHALRPHAEQALAAVAQARTAATAVAELESGNLDAACEQGVRAVEVAGRISSARTTEYVKDLLHRLEPYGDEPRVVELRERARPLLMAPA